MASPIEGEGHGDWVLMKLIYMYNESPEDFSEVKSLLGDDGLNIIKNITISHQKLNSKWGSF